MSIVTQARNMVGRARGFGGCYRCGGTWNYAKEHQTPYGNGGQACFPLCEVCWSGLTPEERLPYYKMLMRDWLSIHTSDEHFDETIGKWPKIHRAVMDGL